MISINEYLQLLAVYIQTHASVYHIKRMEIFGSVARGEQTENIHCTNDFLDSVTGTLLLDGVCMKLIATGESIKNLDKLTNGSLLILYAEIP
ncbi:MAG: hypothetical protein K2L23_08045 [Odoribacter sp.]|nr:hypothetical protein [Odoribacter sp.]